jgi:thiol-disulfide isomerase/thioredoxin
MSNKLASGTAEALQLSLRGVDGRRYSLPSLAGQAATVVVFVANGCPTVRAYEDRLMRLQEAGQKSGVSVVAVNSNNAALSPPDTFGEMVKRARDRGFNFAYVKDPDGALARSFGAICTPHAFLLDRDLTVVYSGRIDDSRLGNKITNQDLEDAISDLVADQPITVRRTEPFGCSIVW